MLNELVRLKESLLVTGMMIEQVARTAGEGGILAQTGWRSPTGN